MLLLLLLLPQVVGDGAETGLPLALVGPPTRSVNTEPCPHAQDNVTYLFPPRAAFESISDADLSRIGRGSPRRSSSPPHSKDSRKGQREEEEDGPRGSTGLACLPVDPASFPVSFCPGSDHILCLTRGTTVMSLCKLGFAL